MIYTFYACWIPNEEKLGAKNDLEQYFGAQSVLECLNRIESKIVDCPESLVNEKLLRIDLNSGDNWIEADNLIGCLINNIEL